MAQESCNLNKDEAEVLKPSSPSSSSPPPPPPPTTASPPPLFLKPPQELPIQRPGRLDTSADGSCYKKVEKKAEFPFATGGVEEKEALRSAVKYMNRCSSCEKKVGLMGFRCRCGDLFCGRHRHSDTHECSFDYKAAGREEIAKANPIVRASKIIKI